MSQTSFGAYAKKRYRFCGKEKDEETRRVRERLKQKIIGEQSGMYYYGARYYSPWLCRFISADPLAGKYPFYTPYQYAGNQPINFIDLDGLEQAQPQTPAGEGAKPTPSVNNTNGFPSTPPNLVPSLNNLLNNAVKEYQKSGVGQKQPTISESITKKLGEANIKSDNTNTASATPKTVAEITKIPMPKQSTIKADDPLKGKSDFERVMITSPVVKGVATGVAATAAIVTIFEAPLTARAIGGATDMAVQLSNDSLGAYKPLQNMAAIAAPLSPIFTNVTSSMFPIQLSDLRAGNTADIFKNTVLGNKPLSSTIPEVGFGIGFGKLGGKLGNYMQRNGFSSGEGNMLFKEVSSQFLGSQGANVGSSLLDSYKKSFPAVSDTTLRFKF